MERLKLPTGKKEKSLRFARVQPRFKSWGGPNRGREAQIEGEDREGAGEGLGPRTYLEF